MGGREGRFMRSMAWLVGLAVVGCSSDYKVETDLDPARGPSTSTMTTPGDDDDDTPGTWNPSTDPGIDTGVGDDDDDDASGDDDDDAVPGDDDDDAPGDGELPPGRDRDDPPDDDGDEDCPDGVLATWLSGELMVFSDDPPVSGTLEVAVAALYDVYDVSVAESGPTQTNESAFLRVPNSWDPTGLPSHLGLINCLDDYVAVDPDNLGPVAAGTTQYMGTFWFDAGPNTVELHHYCEHYFAGSCLGLHDAGTPCDSNINSVHFLGEAVCLIPVN